MTTHTLSQTLTNLRQTIRRFARYVAWLSLSLVLIMAVLATYRSVSMPAAAAPIKSSTRSPMSVSPAQQAVFDYLWAHRSNQPLQAPATTLDPAQQSVMDYLHAHERVAPPAPFWDQAAQAVRDYLRAHSR